MDAKRNEPNNVGIAPNLAPLIDLHAGRASQPCKEQTHAIIGCAFDVLNELGHGFNEKCYENALVVEFKLRARSK